MKNKIKRVVIVCLSLFITIAINAQSKNLLIFSKTEGFRHKSIEKGVKAIKKLGKENLFLVTATENADYFNKDSLNKFDAIIFLNTTGDVLNKDQQIAFESFIKSGKGLVGIHSASDTEYDWPWYGKLIGAYFDSHPKQQNAIINIVDKNHLSTKNLPLKWEHFDEWYNFKEISSKIHVLARLDETSYVGGKNGDNHPISWCQEFDGGKMFYTGLGHTKAAYKDSKFLKHLLGGIQYVLE
ncbi:ThuA domain-containing protein [Aureibaculum marinum]|uniref:ThuA domain-containing protein n=1 Tax=Aureibaculum marinum TaxID=2487930 RepID=A0A3N4NUG6_9FLAO|nr:ThuA domain-containing protein [Aureibaculum marinum]RPD97978.1 ThuA domain-containing protein [Aureibaculum marinum]